MNNPSNFCSNHHRRYDHYNGSSGWSTFPSYMIFRKHQNEHQNEEDCTKLGQEHLGRQASNQCYIKNRIIWLSIYAIFILMFFWFAENYKETESFNLTVGETVRMKPTHLWSTSLFQIESLTSDPGLEVYQFTPVLSKQTADCPLTNGPPLLLESKQSLFLNSKSYQYEYYHLNAGSSIVLDAFIKNHAHFGKLNIYLLQGSLAVESLKHGGESSHSFRAHSIMKRFLASNGESSAKLSYAVPQDDLYALIYDNISFETINLQVKLHINKATHALERETLFCTAIETSMGDCKWDLNNNDSRRNLAASCLVVKAVSSELYNVLSIFDARKVPEISMQVNKMGRYDLYEGLLFVVAAPGLLFLLQAMKRLFLKNGCNRQRRHQRHDMVHINTSPSSSEELTPLNESPSTSSTSNESFYQTIVV